VPNNRISGSFRLTKISARPTIAGARLVQKKKKKMMGEHKNTETSTHTSLRLLLGEKWHS
jgi:hypothetical protein